MSFEQFEEDILEIVNEAEGELSEGLIRRKIIAQLRRIEGTWDFPYMYLQDVVSVPVGNAPVVEWGWEWKTIHKLGLWSTDVIDSTLPTHGGGAKEFLGFLQKIDSSDLKLNHYETLNDTAAWGLPLKYQRVHSGMVDDPLLIGQGPQVFRSKFQLYPPSDQTRNLSIIGYAYTPPYADTAGAVLKLTDDHWMLHYGRELLECWTILSLTPALQDATLAKFYQNLVPSAQETLLKSEANSDWEGLDETVEYTGESDI